MMQVAGALCYLLFFTAEVSASRNMAQHQPVLLGGKSTSKLGCKVGEPNCGKQLKMVLEVNTVLKVAEDREKKAEEAEVEAQKLMETASEVQSAKKEEQSQEAAETAVEEKLDTAKEEIKKEDTELRQEKQTLEAEEQTLKQTQAVNPEAAAIVMKDEENLEDEVKAKEIGKEVKVEKAKTVKQEKLVVEMKVATSQAKVVAKTNLFKKEDKIVKRMETQITPKVMYKDEVKIYKIQTAIVKAAAKEPVDLKTAGVAELVKATQEPKVELASEKIATAKIEATEAKEEQKKAEAKIKEVVEEAKTTEKVNTITKKFGSVKELEEQIKKCQPCEVVPGTTETAPLKLVQAGTPEAPAQVSKPEAPVAPPPATAAVLLGIDVAL